MLEQIKTPKTGFKSLIKLKFFCKKQNVIIVGNNIANDNGPFTRTPKEKIIHIITGYKYLNLTAFPFFKKSFNKKYCWIHIKLNKVASVFAKCASPRKAIEDAKTKLQLKIDEKGK